jgi:methionyl-tRNA formyltransferase
MRAVLLVGLGSSALSALDSLAARFSVVGVIRDVTEGTEAEDEVARRAQELSIRILSDISPEGVEHALIDTQPDCVVVCSYNRILSARMLQRCKFVNVHYAPLPRYRGRAPVNWAIINGETETAITIHVVSPQLDAGNILYRAAVEIGPDDTAGDILVALDEILRKELGDTIARYLNGYTGKPQDDSLGTYGCSRTPDDGEIDWSRSTEQIYSQIRALWPPWPHAFTYIGNSRISVVQAVPVSDAQHFDGRIPGRIVRVSRSAGFVDVLTGDGVLRIYKVAKGTGPLLPASAIITSTRQTLGLRTVDLIARIEELEKRLDMLSHDCGDSDE